MNKEGEPDGGFKEFFALPNITISNWLGEESGIQITGSITEDVKRIFYGLQEPAFNGEEPELRDGKLFQRGREMLSIGNFTNRLIHLTEQEIKILTSKGVNISSWEEVAMAIVEGKANEPIDWNDEDLKSIAGIISHWLSGDKKH